MKSVLVILLVAFSISARADIPERHVEFYRDNISVQLTRPLQQSASEEILQTFKATSYDSTSYAGSAEEWKKLATGSYFILHFSIPNEVIGNWDRKLKITEILIPVSQDHHYLARNAKTGKYWAFTKMIPEQRAKQYRSIPFNVLQLNIIAT